MMSDYDVTLVNDNSADMYVIFHGPKDSESLSTRATAIPPLHTAHERAARGVPRRSVRRRVVEGARRAPRRLSVQVALNRLL